MTVILLGSGLRLANLEAKPYWFNEVFTSLKISGYDEHRDVNPALYTGALLGTDDLLRYQRLRPDSSVLDVIQTLRRKDVKWPPGYLVLARSWSRLWGTSVLVMRRLPALLSLLAFPALYWLSRELFESKSVAWMATALHAASPMFLAQAQEARPWSLWVAIMVAATAVLLWALRTRAAKAWWLYAVCASAGLYVNALSLLVIGVHGTHVLLQSRGRWEEPCRRWSLSTLAALASFAPWAACIAWNYQNAVATSSHLRTWPGLHVLAAGWAEGLRRVFLVPPAGPGAPVLFVAVLALVCYSFWVLWRDAPLRTSSLVTLLTAAALVLVRPAGSRLPNPGVLAGTLHVLQLSRSAVVGRPSSDRSDDRPRAEDGGVAWTGPRAPGGRPGDVCRGRPGGHLVGRIPGRCRGRENPRGRPSASGRH